MFDSDPFIRNIKKLNAQRISALDVIEVIAGVLQLDHKEIRLNTSLTKDLGAMSGDLLKISVALGKKFGFYLSPKAILGAIEGAGLYADRYFRNGKLTDIGARLFTASPISYNSNEVRADMNIDAILQVTTVRHWMNLCNSVQQHPSRNGDTVLGEFFRLFQKRSDLMV